MKTFKLNRTTDTHGKTGTGTVCVGVILPDNKVVLQWLGEINSIVIHENIENVEKIHCANMNSIIEYDYTEDQYKLSDINLQKLAGVITKNRCEMSDKAYFEIGNKLMSLYSPNATNNYYEE